MKNIYILLFSLLAISNNTTAQIITTVAGTGIAGYNNDSITATTAQLNNPRDVAVDTAGNIYIADWYNYRIRRIDAATGIITTIAGTGVNGHTGDGGLATAAQIHLINAICLDDTGNIYLVESSGGSYIRKINATTGTINTIAGTGVAGPFNGDGILATTANIGASGIATDHSGNIYIADFSNLRARKINAQTGIITTIAGTGSAVYNGDGIPAINANLGEPYDVVVDDSGNVYIADVSSRIRKINTATGLISTVAGIGVQGYNGDNIPANTAELHSPSGVDVDSSGNIYIADVTNQRVRKVDVITGTITTVAGTGTGGYNGDNILAVTAQVNGVARVALRGYTMYIADLNNNRIRKVVFCTPVIPVATISASPSGTVAPGTTISFTATATGAANPTYQWKKNGVAIAGATTNPYNTNSLNNSDTITCTIHTTDTCATVDSANSAPVVVHISTGVNNIANNNTLTIYPSPVKEVLYIKTSNPVNAYSVTDVTGRVLLQGKGDKVNVSGLANGIYLLQVTEGKQKLLTRFTKE